METMAKKSYADDYETVITTDEKGNDKKTAIYRGDYFEFVNDEEDILRFKQISILLVAVIIVLHIGAGFVNNRGMYQFYVALPYVIAFLPLIYLTMEVLRLPKEKRKFRRDEIGLSFDRMKPTSIILFILLVIGLLGESAFLLVGEFGNQNELEYLFFALEFLEVASVYYLIFRQRQIRVQNCGKLE